MASPTIVAGWKYYVYQNFQGLGYYPASGLTYNFFGYGPSGQTAFQVLTTSDYNGVIGNTQITQVIPGQTDGYSEPYTGTH